MSSYIHFFLTRDEKDFLPIGCYSRSDEIYQAFAHFANYEKVRPITKDILNHVHSEVNLNCSDLNETICQRKSEIEIVKGFNNSTVEKIEAISKLTEEINDLRELIKDKQRVLSFIKFLYDCIDCANDTSYDSSEEDKLNGDRYIFFGIETGYKIESEMIG